MDEQQKQMLEELLFSGEKKLSFAKMLYFGAFHESSAFPFPSMTQEEKADSDAFIQKFNTFADEHIDGDAIDRDANIPDHVISGLGELGLLGYNIPTEFGGLGKTQHSYCRVMELLAQRCASTALFVNAHQSIGVRALVLFGTHEQQKTWLKPLAKGEKVAAFSLTEPNAGSDASGVETIAVYKPEKDCYVLNGEKQWTTNGSIADVLTVMAQTEMDTPRGKENKITAFLVTPDMKGFSVTEQALEKVGMRGTRTANLCFENMEVPTKNILGPKGGGLRVCLTVLDFGRVTFGATCTGIAKYLVKRALEHAHGRHQFKRTLSTFPLVKRKLAMMSALTYAMDATTYLTAGLVDEGVEEFMLEAAILKVFNSDSMWTILYDTMQIYGGRSFFTSEPFERMMRDARLNMIGEGSNEVLQAFIALVGIRDVGMQFKNVSEAFTSPISQFSTLKMFGKQCCSYLFAPKIPIRSSEITKEGKELAKRVRLFAKNIAKLLSIHREDIIEMQLILDRVANIATALYTTTAVLSKLDSEIQAGDKRSIPSGRLYCRHAFDTIDHNLHTLYHNHDNCIEKVSDLLTGSL
ncbi:Acyl-CoA dehydrogenase family member 9, mitochondrial [Chlamydiales bacterium SCGC AG-110-M15]|nr:Acyl-CoA dehydrogenase family member 9, mitochondrial [Chlamydiales bacterium SCGC AG-110-M15]